MDDRTRRATPRRITFVATLVVAVAACSPVVTPTTPAVSAVADASPSIADATPSVVASAPTPQSSVAPPDEPSPTQARIDYLATRVADDPADPDAQLDLGLALLQRIRETADPSLYAPAEAALDTAHRLLPNDPGPLVGLGGLELGRHRFASALKTGRAAVRLAPDSPSAGSIVIDALIELGRYEPAFKAATALATRAPDLASLSRLSYVRELQGDIDGALSVMREAADARGIAPENTAFAWSIVGHLERLAGDEGAADAAYRSALRFVPGHAPSLAGLGRLAIGDGDLTTAKAEFERAAAVVPLPEYVIALGEIAEASGDAKSARREYETARAEIALFKAAGVTVDLDLALFECDHGDPQAGLGYAKAAYAATPTVRAADALGWCLYRTGDIAGATRRSTEAMRLGSRDPLFLYHAGAIALAAGDPVAARARLTAALNGDPGFSATGARDARALLASLGT